MSKNATKKTDATETTETSTTATNGFEVQSGPAPEPAKIGRAATGLSATLLGMKVNEWFRVPRKGNRRDGSKSANIVRLAKKHGISVTMYPENETTDIVKRVK